MNISTGLAIGHLAADFSRKETEVKQGKNHYQGAIYQTGKIMNLTNVTALFIPHIPNASLKSVAEVINFIAPITGAIVCPLAAGVKQGHYEQIAKVFNNYSYIKMPAELGNITHNSFESIAEHSGAIINTAIAIGGLALPFFGNLSTAGGMLFPIAYHALDSKGFVPLKISLMAEKIMPSLSTFFLFLSGGVVTKVFTAASLATSLPTCSTKIQEKIEGAMSRMTAAHGATIEQVQAPVIEKRNLSLQEILEILDGDDEDFELNVAHCGKSVVSQFTFVENHNFDDFYSFFDKVSWEDRYNLLVRVFKGDERYLESISEILHIKPCLKNNVSLLDFARYVEELAEKKGVSKEICLAEQLKVQFKDLISGLKGEIKMAGSSEDIEDCIASCSKILGYLNSLSETKITVEMEDILLKLAVEGGQYCARGVKRASSEILNGIAQSDRLENLSVVESYERKLKQKLEQMRGKILQGNYLKFVERIQSFFKKGKQSYVFENAETKDEQAIAIAQDVHTLDIYKSCLSLGFFPMTENERNRMGTAETFMWASPIHPFRKMRENMYDTYVRQMDFVFSELGEIYFAEYFQSLISEMTCLTEEQKQLVLDKYINNNEWTWEIDESFKRFHRLVFVILGVLKRIDLYEDWQEISAIEIEQPSESDSEVLLEDWNLL